MKAAGGHYLTLSGAECRLDLEFDNIEISGWIKLRASGGFKRLLLFLLLPFYFASRTALTSLKYFRSELDYREAPAALLYYAHLRISLLLPLIFPARS